MIDQILTYLAPILTDEVFQISGVGVHRSLDQNTNKKLTVGIVEDSNGDYPKLGISNTNTGYLRLTDDIVPVSTQKIGCNEFVYRVRVPVSYVVAYLNKEKSEVVDYMMTKVSEVKQAYWQRTIVDKEKIEEEESIDKNLFRLIKIQFNLEFQYAYNGECPTEFTCIPC
jgi:hypothetical protein